MLKIFGCFFLISLVGCSVELQDAESEKPIIHKGFERFPMSGTYYEIMVGSNPNEYSVRLIPPPGTTKIEKNEQRPVYSYVFSGSQTVRIEVPIPEDLVITGWTEWTEDLSNYRRVFFSENSFAVTNGRTLSIDVEEIIAAPNSGILSFRNSAPEGQLGKSGGRLQVKTNSILGSLIVQLNGQAGGPGKSGTPYQNRAATGAPAHTGIRLSPGVSQCSENKVGGKGADGLPGQDGEPGSSGGDGGRIELRVAENLRENFVLRSAGGSKGVGGKGGPGQPGGLGGASMNFPQYFGENALREPILQPCPKIPDGPMGIDGVSGRDGPEGLPGKEGTISFL